MARTLSNDAHRATLTVAACLICLGFPSSGGQVTAIALGGAVGVLALPRAAPAPRGDDALAPRIPLSVAVALLVLFFTLLLALPWLATLSAPLRLINAFYLAGSLVFGGGHVVLPLLQQTVVTPGWVAPDTFLAGYGATQAMPGPIFTFAAFLGAVEAPAPNGVAGALMATVAIFLPSFFLVAGLLPFWDRLRHRLAVQAAMRGVNAAVVGVLLAALYDPIWTGTVHNAADFGFGLVAFLLLTLWAAPPWIVVLAGAAAGNLLATFGVFG